MTGKVVVMVRGETTVSRFKKKKDIYALCLPFLILFTSEHVSSNEKKNWPFLPHVPLFRYSRHHFHETTASSSLKRVYFI